MSGRIWTKREDRILRKYFPHEKTDITCQRLGRGYSSVSQHARFLGLEKTSAYMAEIKAETTRNLTEGGKAHRFEKGLVPPNKGKKQSEWLTGEGYERVKSTQFKKGERPKTAPPIGTVTIRNEKGRQYKYMGGRPLQQIEWEKEHGKIPKGHFLVCRSDDTLNVSPDNWELIDRDEGMRRNTLHRYPKEVALTIQAIGVLNRQINKRKKEKDEKHN